MGDVFDKMFDVVAFPVILANLRIVLPHDAFVVVLIILCVVFSFLLVALTLRKRSNSYPKGVKKYRWVESGNALCAVAVYLRGMRGCLIWSARYLIGRDG